MQKDVGANSDTPPPGRKNVIPTAVGLRLPQGQKQALEAENTELRRIVSHLAGRIRTLRRLLAQRGVEQDERDW